MYSQTSQRKPATQSSRSSTSTRSVVQVNRTTNPILILSTFSQQSNCWSDFCSNHWCTSNATTTITKQTSPKRIGFQSHVAVTVAPLPRRRSTDIAAPVVVAYFPVTALQLSADYLYACISAKLHWTKCQILVSSESANAQLYQPLSTTTMFSVFLNAQLLWTRRALGSIKWVVLLAYLHENWQSQ